MAYFRQRGFHLAHKLDQGSSGWLGLVANAANQAFSPNASITAAAIAYFALFSLFPFALLSISIASFALGPSMDQQLTLEKLEFVAPALGQLLGQNIDDIIRTRGPITGIALLGLVWSASTIFYTLTHTLNGVWSSQRKRPVWKRRGLAILFVLVFVGPALILASFAGSLIASLRTQLPELIMPFAAGISFVVAFMLDVVLFLLLYILLPHGIATWREIFPGALAAGLLWELAKKAFLFIISSYISVSNLVYGSVSAIIAFLAWAYLSGIIFLFGAFLSVAYFEFKQKQKKEADALLEKDYAAESSK